MNNIMFVNIFDLLEFLMNEDEEDEELNTALNNSLHEYEPKKQPLNNIDKLEITKLYENIDDSCLICYDKYLQDQYIVKLPCSHFYHKDCIDPWFKNNNTCPCCRNKL